MFYFYVEYLNNIGEYKDIVRADTMEFSDKAVVFRRDGGLQTAVYPLRDLVKAIKLDTNEKLSAVGETVHKEL